VNYPIPRSIPPAANSRIGRGESAQTHGAKTPIIPFAALPHDIVADPRLTPTDVRVLAALFYFARADASCWPCDHSIADRVHRHAGTVRRALRRLEDLGYIRRAPTRENPTGRLIHLTCKEPDWPRPAPAPTPVRRRVGGSSAGARGGRAPALADGDVIVERTQDRELDKGETSERSRPEIPSTPAIPREQPVVVAVPTAEVLPPAPPAPTPQPESEPALLPDCRSEPPGPPPAEIWTRPQPVPPARPVVPGPGAARPAFRTLPAGSSAYSQSEPAPGQEKLPLTPEEKARLEAMDPGVRDQILTWLMLGDPILMREARAKLAPPRPKPEAPTTLPGILARIREDPSYPGLAAAWLARDLSDPKSYNGFLARCREAWQGLIPVPVLQDAYRQATGPQVRNPGAIFQVACQRRE
jgi:DNA-binding Lrp family transcriptional regulator